MATRKSRKVREPIGRRMRTEIPKNRQAEGYVYRMVNDEPGRIDDFLEHGWELVDKQNEGVLNSTDLGSCQSVFVGQHETGLPKQAYSMRIRQEWYDEDQAAKQAINDRVDEAIEAGVEPVERAYTPGQPSMSVTENAAKILTDKRQAQR